jgi:FkbM family methyltransferase
MNKKIYIEVGSNHGTDTEQFINDNSIVYCFEPSMELSYELWQRYRDKDNVIIIPFAIDIESSFKKFNIAGTSNWGCSSLNDFNPKIHEEWPNRPDFMFTHSYIVPTISLYDFIEIYKIPYIDYLWIDAQGHDFNVIKSLKDKISIVREGRCEAAHSISLYDNIDNNYLNIINYLSEYGFDTTYELDRSGIGAECDIMFKLKTS